MNIHSIYRILLTPFRSKRMKKFIQYFEVNEFTSILDVGGSLFNWTLIPQHPRLIILNVNAPKKLDPRALWVVADGRQLPFQNNTFNIVYSNSVIEHLGGRENQALFAKECARVGTRYYIQTPNKWFPIEPHYLAPMIHWLPKSVQPNLIRYFTLRGWLTKPTPQQCQDLVDELNLLGGDDIHNLFPDATIWRERVGGIPKSLIAVRD